MAKKLNRWLLFAGIQIIVIVVLLVLWLHIHNAPKCNDDASKAYISKGSNCAINFLCIQGKEAFKDQCGCGCRDIAQTNATGCNYNDAVKSYIKKESPCVINFLCTRDRVAFSDECGCGCKLANATST